ncbi:MAG: hypothetical protein ACLFOA_09250 [Desulfohalobiaceae bacterium]
MRYKQELLQLTRSESLSHFFLDRQDLEEWVKVCTETYLICSQIHAGDLDAQHLEQIPFQKIYEHIYTEQGGCPWCKNRVDQKMRLWMRDHKQQDQDQAPSRQAGLNVLPVSLS